MDFKQFFCKKVSFAILILLFTPPAQAFIFDYWQWIFIREKFSKNRAATHQLFSAVKSSDRAGAIEALGKGAFINARDRKGKTPLHWAVYKTDILMAELLLERGADPNAVNRRRRTPLHWAIFKPSNELTLLLLEHGADPNVQDARKWTPLHWLAVKPDEINRSYVKKRISENDQRKYETPLLWNETDLEKARLLLEFKADPNLPDELHQTPLHYAVMNDRLEITQLFVEKEANVDAQNWVNETPLHLISKRKRLKPNSLAIAQFLLENEADSNALNFYKKSPMQFAQQNKLYALQETFGQFGGIIPPQNSCMKVFQKWTKPFRKK